MDENTQKEEFSYGYVHALAASCGYITNRSTRPEDNRGFDLSIIGDEIENGGAPRILVQTKCTTPKYFYESQEVFKYDLAVKNYKKLIAKAVDTSVLIVVIVPERIKEWMYIDELKKETLIKHNAYYISLQGEPAKPNKEKTRIDIPKQNLLTQESLKKLMENTSDLRSKIMTMLANQKMEK